MNEIRELIEEIVLVLQIQRKTKKQFGVELNKFLPKDLKSRKAARTVAIYRWLGGTVKPSTEVFIAMQKWLRFQKK